MSCIFKWVQLSDLHFQAENASFNAETLRETLPKYLKTNVKDCDALILTGDYRYAVDQEKNHTRVSNYISTLAKSLKVDDNIFAVPGNHDLDRSTSRNYLMQGVQKDYTPEKGTIDSTVCSSLLKDFTFFEDICKKLQLKSCLNDKDDECPHTVVQLANCNLLLMNTSLTAGCDNDSGRLIVGSRYITALVKKHNLEDKPTIAIGHHSLDELEKQEKTAVAKEFDRYNIRLYLCGHAHEHRYDSFGENGKEVIVGCLKQDDNSVMATFAVGELFDDGRVVITSHMWDSKEQGWYVDPPRIREYVGLYPKRDTFTAEEAPQQLAATPFSVYGYTLLGVLGQEGIMYYWKKDGEIVESIALNQRIKIKPSAKDCNTSAYTISTSIGCPLNSINKQCVFCETGTKEYKAPLTGEDIALQCIYMAEFDSDCEEFPEVRNHAREFAFMGQGEPGFNYPAVRKAILLNDIIMDRLGQKVSRYIISTCGTTDLIPAIIEDIKKGIYKNKVSVHLSLHEVGDYRKKLMPISSIYDYSEVIKQCKALYKITKEKIGVGVLMFDCYSVPNAPEETYTLTPQRLRRILNELDSEVFRIDLCTVNNTSAGKQMRTLRQRDADVLEKLAKAEGFEVRIFSSFGSNKHAGCGMLASKEEDIEPLGSDGVNHFNRAVELLAEASEQYLVELEKEETIKVKKR